LRAAAPTPGAAARVALPERHRLRRAPGQLRQGVRADGAGLGRPTATRCD